jgi:hypothetical protein
MLDFVTPPLAELLLRGLRDLAADAIPRASAAGIVLTIGVSAMLHLRHRLRTGRRPRRPLPAPA